MTEYSPAGEYPRIFPDFQTYAARCEKDLKGNKHNSLHSGRKYLRNRKHVPCFYRVIQTRVEVWEKEKCCGNTSRRRVFPQLFPVLPNFHECLYNSIETRSTCFLFLLENNTTRKGKQLVNFDYQNVNSLCSRHHYVNSARWFCHSASIELCKHDF